eukprot:4744736-Prymnesium_polylepis.1
MREIGVCARGRVCSREGVHMSAVGHGGVVRAEPCLVWLRGWVRGRVRGGRTGGKGGKRRGADKGAMGAARRLRLGWDRGMGVGGRRRRKQKRCGRGRHDDKERAVERARARAGRAE